MKIVACTPSSRAAHATAWPWLPALAAITPAARSAGESDASDVDGAADLERAGALEVLGLEQRSRGPVARPRAPRSRRPAVSARAVADPLARGLDVSERRVGLRRHRSGRREVEHRLEDLMHGGERIELAALDLVEQPRAARGRRRPHSPGGGAPAPRRPRTPRPRGCGARRSSSAPVGLEPGAVRRRSRPTARRCPRRAAPRSARSAAAAPTAPSASTCRTSFAVCRACGWSALLIAITSGISMIPAFSACTESPEPGISASTTVSAIESTPTSLWPGADRLEEDDVLAGRRRAAAAPGASTRRGRPRGRACPSSG